ncbi:MAG: hypothetical protein PHU88_03755 [candidate division Zixibacteria bacterium]|nr:hypothetical protein [candidate division Zixibacteria bacterium]
MNQKEISTALKQAERGITGYLQEAQENGLIDPHQFHHTLSGTLINIELWLKEEKLDIFSPHLRQTIISHIRRRKWKELVNVFHQELRFGTAGIRGLMAFDRKAIRKLKTRGLEADILKGPHTFNEIVLLKTTAGVARFGRDKGFSKVVIGYDSRVRGIDFARLIAELFLACDYTVFFFDAPCPYPEITFAIPHESIRADLGVLISASHNDYRYNGYKLSGPDGSQLDPHERDLMYREYISRVQIKDIPKPCPFSEAGIDKLFFLGGHKPVRGFDYADRENKLIDFHTVYIHQLKKFLFTEIKELKYPRHIKPLSLAYCPYHGAGYRLFPRVLEEAGFTNIVLISGRKRKWSLDKLNGLFPAFNSTSGHEQQPDPGDPAAAAIALQAFKEDYPNDRGKMDILIGTDPDADRCALTVRVPSRQKHIYGAKDYYLLPADDMWTLIIWFRLYQEMQKRGNIADAEKKFLTISHTTTDSLTYLARKHHLGVVKAWVGFAAMAAAARDIWGKKMNDLKDLSGGRNARYNDLCHPYVCECLDMDNGQRSINIGIMEQSNGFSILGGPPPDRRSLGSGGHVRDKDGLLAGLLLAEVAAWAKTQGLTPVELLDRYIYLDPDIGMFTTFYEPDPLKGEYPGIEGDRVKRQILQKVLMLAEECSKGTVTLAGFKVTAAAVYRTGKYDHLYPPTESFKFPDEGVRLFLDDGRIQHLTVRPSGTSSSLRFHIQLHTRPETGNLLEIKEKIRLRGKLLMDELRERLGAPRNR